MNRANPHQGWSGAGHSEHPPEHYQATLRSKLPDAVVGADLQRCAGR